MLFAGGFDSAWGSRSRRGSRCPGEHDVNVFSCSLPFYLGPSRRVLQQVADGHGVGHKDVVDFVLIEKLEGPDKIHDLEVRRKNPTMFEDVESRIDKVVALTQRSSCRQRGRS